MDRAPAEPAGVVLASDVLPGDEITELDTPDGPWYRVLRVDTGRGCLLVNDGDAVGVEVDVEDWSSSMLRRAPATG